MIHWLIKLQNNQAKSHTGFAITICSSPSLNTASPGCYADNILGISDAVYPYLTISDHF